MTMHQHCKVWAVANQKGGVGKTTTVVALAGLLAEWKLRVLLIDLDPHGSLSSYFGIDLESLEHSSYSLFQGTPLPTTALIHNTAWPGLDVLPASPALATLDRQLGAGPGKGLIIKHWLGSVMHQYDHVFIDCASMLGVLMVNALVACDHVLVPTQTEFLALNGLQRMRRTIEMIQSSQHTELSWLVIPTMFDRRTRASPQSLRRMREQFGHHVWGDIIPVDTQLREASKVGALPSVFTPRGRAVEIYRKLLAFLLGMNRPDTQTAMVS